MKTRESIDRFDLEQDIMECWSVVEDIKTLSWRYSDASPPMSEDDLMNYLLGLQTIYQIKFEKLFDTFEQCIKNNTLKDGPTLYHHPV